ncbi:MAG TPA: hypothetical protein DER12_08085 [Lachnospiraceae bacterium]|nr:hypothetical protein [Lachnospiraceae bacterium]
MNKKTHKKYVALLTMLAMVVCTMFCTNTVKADTDLPWNESEVVETSTCVVNGVERSLIVLKNTLVYLKIGDVSPKLVYLDAKSIKFDQYGTIWAIDADTSIRWWNYDLAPNDTSFKAILNPTADNPNGFIDDVESFIFDENNQFVVGYKTLSGQTYPILTLDEMKEILKDSSSTPTPTPTPSNIPTPTPTVPTATPTVPATTPPAPKVSPVATPPTTSTPAVIPKTTVTPKVSVKKKAGYSCLSIGNKVTSKYKLAKGKLTWKGSSKSKKYSGIKSAAFIKKSGNLVFLTKKGKVYTLSPKGKKKCIVKKKAKKLILKNKFAVKVKVGKKFINIANK